VLAWVLVNIKINRFTAHPPKHCFHKKMTSHIQIKLFASLQEFTPPSSDEYPIDAGLSIQSLLEQLNIPPEKAKLIFVNGVKADLTESLTGGERVGIFPPVGGG
jgi:molybdopterin converting factor small subunit